jgi:cell division protein FtsL
MATATLTIPRARRRPRNQPAAGRARFPEIYFVKHIDNSHLRREVDLEKRRECFGLLGLGILVFLFVMLFAWQHFQCVRNGYEIEQLKAEQTALEQWNRQLHLEQASLADPQRIDTLARQELGLVSPTPQQVIHVGGTGQAERPELARNFAADTAGTPRQP